MSKPRSGGVKQHQLKEAIRKARQPIFIIQAENDYRLETGKVLGAELRRKMIRSG